MEVSFKMQQQRNRMQRTWRVLGLALGLGLGMALLGGPAGAEMYTWRTDDGAVAYTDDPKHIPARYADRAVKVPRQRLEDYARFTPEDDAASDHYAARLGERLEHLRKVNAAPALPPVGAAPPGTVAQRTLSLRTGDERSPELNLPVGDPSQGPVVVEPVNAKQTGDFRTRRVTVVRQGGQTIAVIKGNPHHFNPATDIHDEDALDEGVWDE